MLVFDYEQKTIGFYKNREEIGLKIKEKKDYSYILILVMILVILLFILLVVILIKNLNKKHGRKIRKNELDDDFDYEIQKNEDNN